MNFSPFCRAWGTSIDLRETALVGVGADPVLPPGAADIAEKSLQLTAHHRTTDKPLDITLNSDWKSAIFRTVHSSHRSTIFLRSLTRPRIKHAEIPVNWSSTTKGPESSDPLGISPFFGLDYFTILPATCTIYSSAVATAAVCLLPGLWHRRMTKIHNSGPKPRFETALK